MNDTELVARTAEHVRDLFAGEGSGHDWWHIYRVWQMSLRLAQDEPVDLTIVQLGALLHDIADWKFHGGDEHAGSRVAREWLLTCEAAPQIIDQVTAIIDEISFKGAGVATPMSSREGEIVQDADRLDAIGAIGIARTFAYGGHAGNPMFDPELTPVQHTDFVAYKTARGTTINHFYEKLLLLKDRMHTEAARAIAEERHAYMEQFLARFRQEWDGEA